MYPGSQESTAIILRPFCPRSVWLVRWIAADPTLSLPQTGRCAALGAYLRMRLRESSAISSANESVAIPATESDMAYGMINWSLWTIAPQE